MTYVGFKNSIVHTNYFIKIFKTQLLIIFQDYTYIIFIFCLDGFIITAGGDIKMPTYDKTQTYLITGGAGFIGSNLVHHLTSIRYKTVVLFN